MGITTVIFVIAYLTGCLMALTRHPIFGLVTYVAVFYLHPPSRWWGASLPDPGWALLAAAVTAFAVLTRKHKIPLGPLFSQGAVKGLIFFLLWLCVQAVWALDATMHTEMIVLFFKYIVLVALMYVCIDSEKHLRYFLWAHVLGCFFLGWIAFTTYSGGRFEGFGGPGIGDANTGGFQIVTGILIGAALFLAGDKKARIALIALMPIIVNGLITTISRSGFLAAFVGGLVFNFFAAQQTRKLVRVLSILGVVLFLGLANDVYWKRIESLKQAGEQVEGVDTGTSRLVIMNAQFEMFKAHPMGCGHRCTATLSSQYMEDQYLTGPPGRRSRSSHNTFLSLLVEQGLPGAIMYVIFALWAVKKVFSVARICKRAGGELATFFPAVAAGLLITFIGDLFVDYLKLEVRIWFIALLLILERMARTQEAAAKAAAPNSAEQPLRRPGTQSPVAR
jgi:O-antigen ligase